MEAPVSAHSQAYPFSKRVAQAKVEHGQEIRADLPGIRVVAMAHEWFTAKRRNKGDVLFCTIGPEVDGGDLGSVGTHARRWARRSFRSCARKSSRSLSRTAPIWLNTSL